MINDENLMDILVRYANKETLTEQENDIVQRWADQSPYHEASVALMLERPWEDKVDPSGNVPAAEIWDRMVKYIEAKIK